MSMLHESEEDGDEGILSIYDTPFVLSTYVAVEAARDMIYGRGLPLRTSYRDQDVFR